MPDLDYRALKFWVDIGQLLIFAAFAAYAWMLNRYKANESSIVKTKEQLTDSIKKIDERVAHLESELAHAPSHEDMTVLHSRINEAAQKLTSVQGELKQMNNTMHLMHQHLLNKK
jgi:chromosome segregation ATPase